MIECIRENLGGGGGRCNVMVCTCEILVGGGLFGQVKCVVIKISFSKGGVM